MGSQGGASKPTPKSARSGRGSSSALAGVSNWRECEGGLIAVEVSGSLVSPKARLRIPGKCAAAAAAAAWGLQRDPGKQQAARCLPSLSASGNNLLSGSHTLLCTLPLLSVRPAAAVFRSLFGAETLGSVTVSDTGSQVGES